MNTEDFVTYEQALALKELGFREECLYYYNVYNQFSPNLNYKENIDDVNDLLFSHNTYAASKTVCDAPTLAQAQKWLRKNKNYLIYIEPTPHEDIMAGWINSSETMYSFNIRAIIPKEYEILDIKVFNSPEEALSAGITECIKLLNKG